MYDARWNEVENKFQISSFYGVPGVGASLKTNNDIGIRREVIDHLGLQQPFEPPAPPAPFAELPKLLDLAQYENIAVKISGACTLSHEPFPYDDIWEPLGRIFDQFGFDRCMWGTDWTRAVNLLTYDQGVAPFRLTDRLSDGDRADLMGRTLERVYNWSPSES